VEWRRDSLVIHTTSRPDDNDLVQTDVWYLSADGTMLSIKRAAAHGGTPMESPTFRLNKQAKP